MHVEAYPRKKNQDLSNKKIASGISEGYLPHGFFFIVLSHISATTHKVVTSRHGLVTSFEVSIPMKYCISSWSCFSRVRQLGHFKMPFTTPTCRTWVKLRCSRHCDQSVSISMVQFILQFDAMHSKIHRFFAHHIVSFNMASSHF